MPVPHKMKNIPYSGDHVVSFILYVNSIRAQIRPVEFQIPLEFFLNE